jgi:hypothetical protein
MRISGAIVVLGLLLGGAARVGAQLQSSNAQDWMQGDTLPDLAEDNDWLASGVSHPIATGDFNADGYLDLAISVVGENLGLVPDAGLVHVLYGGTSGLDAATVQTLSQGVGGLLERAEPNDKFGSALASGDFDADGADDLAIGVPGEKLSVASQGAVQIVYGQAGAGLGTRDALLYQGQFPNTDQAGNADYFGRALEVGDFNGDGVDDLAAAAPFDDIQGVSNAGLVVVCLACAQDGLGNPVCQVLTQDQIPGGVNEQDDYFGWTMAAGDFDADGRDDLALGTPLEDVGSVKDAGLLTVVYGSPGGLDPGRYQTFDQQSLRQAIEADDWFGMELAAADFNSNGVDDLAVSAPNESLGAVSNCGIVHTLHGVAQAGLSPGGSVTQDTPLMLDSNEKADRFGWGLAASDFDGDGFPDLAIGVPGEGAESGAVSVVKGSLYGLDPVGNQWWTQNSPGIVSYPEAGDWFGAHLTTGDFDGNGAGDLTVAVPYESGGANQYECGIAHTLYGQ